MMFVVINHNRHRVINYDELMVCSKTNCDSRTSSLFFWKVYLHILLIRLVWLVSGWAWTGIRLEMRLQVASILRSNCDVHFLLHFLGFTHFLSKHVKFHITNHYSWTNEQVLFLQKKSNEQNKGKIFCAHEARCARGHCLPRVKLSGHHRRAETEIRT